MKPQFILIGAAVLYLMKDQLLAMFESEEEQAGRLAREATAAAAAAAAKLPQGQTAPLPPAYQLPPAPAYQTPPPLPPAPAPAAVLLPVTEDMLKRASWDPNTAALLGDRARMSVHQWNYYREHSGSGRPNPGQDFSVYGDPNIAITASQYLERVYASGLSGIRPY